MIRCPSTPRPTLDARASELGFSYKDIGGQAYWDESAFYRFTLREIEADLEQPTAELAALCLQLAERAAHDKTMLRRLGIPDVAHAMVTASWDRRDRSLYGRFDLAYDGTGPAKLFEYNADTPTSLYESAVFQWFWLEDLKTAGTLPDHADQFNGLHEALIDRWRALLRGKPLHLTSLPNLEDRGTVDYLADCARQAGSRATCLAMREIGLRGKRFVDLDGAEIDWLFKLYPWEWLLADAFGRSAAMPRTRFVEPPWKMMLSTKAILPLLWEMAPGHPNLIEAYFEDDPRRDRLGSSFVRKPLFSREGANVTLVEQGVRVAETSGPYGWGEFVRQALAPQRSFAGNTPVIGSWVIGETPRGIGIREDASRITSNTSRFVPHVILD